MMNDGTKPSYIFRIFVLITLGLGLVILTETGESFHKLPIGSRECIIIPSPIHINITCPCPAHTLEASVSFL